MVTQNSAESLATTVMSRCDALGAISEEEGRLTRRFATPALRQAMEVVAGWCRDAGLAPRFDAAGNLLARYPGTGERVIVLGSHLDSVRDAGRYDGPLGVLVALAAIEALVSRGERLSFAIELVAFADEEGLRYQTAYLGSKAATGTFEPALLGRVDEDGITMADALAAYGGDPDALAAGVVGPQWSRDALIGYCEVHIEQGPVLEARGVPVGVVTTIQGMNRLSVEFHGVAGHAGTVPPALRHDALCAAAEFILAVEATARQREGLVATVGQIAAQPGASNVIPGAVTLSLDVRHPDDATRLLAIDHLRERAAAIATARGVRSDWKEVQSAAAVPCAPRLVSLLARAVEQQGHPLVTLPSGAGHDAVIMSALGEAAMLFVRCAGGVSHNPVESVTTDDVAAAIAVLGEFLHLLAAAEVTRH